MSGTTEISGLPLSPQTPNINNQPVENTKIRNHVQEQINERKNDPNIQQQDYNQLVSEIQQASAAGSLSLPSRDIPQETSRVSNDEQIKPNFIPKESSIDYIANHDTAQDIIRNNMRNQNNMDYAEKLYQEFQLPIIVAILFFMYQLPSVKKHIHKIIPGLFNKDGNPNFYGYIFNSIFFAMLYYFIVNLMHRAAQI